MEKQYGLLGEHLGHSYSPLIHKDFGYNYFCVEIPPRDLEKWVKERSLAGYNVTIPYKQTIIPLLDKVDAKAQSIGAVNVVVCRNGKLEGYNTDIMGMQHALQKAGISIKNKNVLILGSGGTSHTATSLCRNLEADSIQIAGRQLALNYQNVYQEAKEAQIIINTTPVGMFPHNGKSPVDLACFEHLEGVLDVIPNPIFTPLHQQARELGVKTALGLDMLVGQAVFARDLFVDTPHPEGLIESTFARLFGNLCNIVLIGMPGCGKSAVGKALAQLTGKPFVDTDQEIESQSGMTIPQIFAQFGEPHFRALEQEAASKVGQRNAIVIATGGGLVLDEQNYRAIKQNAVIIYLQRDLDLLPTEGRPLSAGENRLDTLYAQRHPVYLQRSDFVIENNTTVEDCAHRIFAQINDLF